MRSRGGGKKGTAPPRGAPLGGGAGGAGWGVIARPSEKEQAARLAKPAGGGHLLGVHAGAPLHRRGVARVHRDRGRPNPSSRSISPTRFISRRNWSARTATTASRRAAREHPEREHLHDLPLADRDRPAADPADDRDAGEGHRLQRGSASTTTPEAHVRFEHAPHIRAKVECSTCPWRPDQQTVARRVVEHGHGVLRELPQGKAGVERLPDLSLLIPKRSIMDRRHFIKLTAITGTSAALTACGNPENQIIRFIPEDELVPGIATGSRASARCAPPAAA